MAKLKLLLTKELPKNIRLLGGCLGDNAIYLLGNVEIRPDKEGLGDDKQYIAMLNFDGKMIRQLIGPNGMLYDCVVRIDDVLALGEHEIVLKRDRYSAEVITHLDIVRFDLRLNPRGRFKVKVVEGMPFTDCISANYEGNAVIACTEYGELKVIRLGKDLKDVKIIKVDSAYEDMATGGSFYMFAKVNPVTRHLWIFEWHGDGAHIHFDDDEIMYINRAHALVVDGELNIIMDKLLEKEISNIDPNNPGLYFDKSGYAYIPARKIPRRRRDYREITGYLVLGEDGLLKFRIKGSRDVTRVITIEKRIEDFAVRELHQDEEKVRASILDIRSDYALVNTTVFTEHYNDYREFIQLIKIEEGG